MTVWVLGKMPGAKQQRKGQNKKLAAASDRKNGVSKEVGD